MQHRKESQTIQQDLCKTGKRKTQEKQYHWYVTVFDEDLHEDELLPYMERREDNSQEYWKDTVVERNHLEEQTVHLELHDFGC